MQNTLFDIDLYLVDRNAAEELDADMGGKHYDMVRARGEDAGIAAMSLILSAIKSGITLPRTLRHINNVSQLFVELAG